MKSVWDEIYREAEKTAESEPILATYMKKTILNCSSLNVALAKRLADKLSCNCVPKTALCNVFLEALNNKENVMSEITEDLLAIMERDPAVNDILTPFLNFKGFHSIQCYRIANYHWNNGKKQFAYYMQGKMSEKFGVDIHPAAKIGKGILIDHATSVVIGETAVVDDNVSMLHEVTLGGTGKAKGDRHPKIRTGVLIGAGAKVLGNVEVGAGCKIAACSVVLNDVQPGCTVAGIPAKIINRSTRIEAAYEMDHSLYKTYNNRT